jgi:hypothetical protein
VGARIASTNRPGAGVEPEKKSSGSMSSSSTTSGSPSDPQSRSTLANRRSLPTASDLAGSERRHGVEPVTFRGEPHRGRDTRAVAAEARDAQVLARDPLDVGPGPAQRPDLARSPSRGCEVIETLQEGLRLRRDVSALEFVRAGTRLVMGVPGPSLDEVGGSRLAVRSSMSLRWDGRIVRIEDYRLRAEALKAAEADEDSGWR